jgi:hypothetical protein
VYKICNTIIVQANNKNIKHRVTSGKSVKILLALVCFSIVEKSKSIKSKTILMLLLRQNVEAKPGPCTESNKPNLILKTHNCNGLRDINKIRGVLTKLRKEVQSEGIALLQETHIID